jgi:hypothetical protein
MRRRRRRKNLDIETHTEMMCRHREVASQGIPEATRGQEGGMEQFYPVALRRSQCCLHYT